MAIGFCSIGDIWFFPNVQRHARKYPAASKKGIFFRTIILRLATVVQIFRVVLTLSSTVYIKITEVQTSRVLLAL